MRVVFFVFFTLLCIVSLNPQEKLREEVDVRWWVIPLFAVDTKDNSVTNLSKKDIELFFDNQKITKFTLYRESFDVEHIDKKIQPEPEMEVEKENMVFLLFDTVLTSPGAIQRAKSIAKHIVSNSAQNCRFVLLTIEPLKGLVYKEGPIFDKTRMTRLIEEEVKKKPNTRIISLDKFIFDAVVGPGNRGETGKGVGGEPLHTEEEKAWRLKVKSGQLNLKATTFFRSFETFYYNINSIIDNKFIYLFSEGISRFQEEQVKQGRYAGMEGLFFVPYLKQVGEYLGRCGAVLFVINSSSGLDSMDSLETGKNSLYFLANQSGGKYLQGTKNKINQTINNFHRAYYQIAFEDSPQYKGKIHKIKIKSIRPGVKIHTLDTTEKGKSYASMKDLEREIFVMNLITQNPLYHSNMITKKAEIIKKSQSKGKITFKTKIPKALLDKKIDLYKMLVDKNTLSTRIEKETIVPKKPKIKVAFKADNGTETNFALINSEMNLAVIEGPGIYEEEQEVITDVVIKDADANLGELSKLLQGTAGYCKRLKEAAFHFFCKEKIAETNSFIVGKTNTLGRDGRLGNTDDDISVNTDRANTDQGFTRDLRSNYSRNRIVKQRVTKYVFDYQLINNSSQVEEQRKILSTNSKNYKKGQITGKLFTYLTERAIFGPITLLGESQQERLNYKLLRPDLLRGRKCAVIIASPKSKKDKSVTYGKIWVDADDYSIRKIEINPKSIKGYDQLQQLAKKLGSRLYLTCIVEYDKSKNGLCFPTKIDISERYKGGAFVLRYIGKKGWLRSKTVVSYEDYTFFKVDVDVKGTRIK